MMISNVIEGLKPVILMIVVQASLAGINIFYKLAGANGMNLSVLIAYRFVFAAAFITPIAAILERKSRPRVTWLILFQSSLAGMLLGSLAQNMYAHGVILTSATLASAMLNIVPAITFILGIFFRMEKLSFSTIVGKAKIIGTITCIGGAMFLSFYKGKEINIWPTIINLVKVVSKPGHVATTQQHGNISAIGIVLLLATCFSWAASLIVQVSINLFLLSKLLRNYPCSYSSSALMMIMAAIQSVVYALCTERDWNQWKLGWNIRLLAASYCGIIASTVIYPLLGWCIKMRGPVYVSIFNPLMLVIVAILGSLILDEKLHVGSVLGSAIIIIGLYMVVWGKSKELKNLLSQPTLSNSFNPMELDQNNFSSHHSIASNVLVGLGLPPDGLNFSSARHEINLADGNTSLRVVPHVDNDDADKREECTKSKRMLKGEIVDLV
ncbi:WAT1-related protein At1g25270-like [Impatiens glandulifera]|uniref:WAT1-related protein At1g25270-like n=1 Tax=Impatiens glandulifera TaxID=253017 RepID=UPI001FB05B12|nr:WAT1-related protein At1g25270-like [Impatiens glandulifera]